MPGQAASTRDHHVPQMYLRRFARRTGAGWQIAAASVKDLGARFQSEVKNVAVERGFYWGTDRDGVPHHAMEKFLTQIERLGASAFRQILDTGKLPSDNAMPSLPLRRDTRLAVSWWMAAQILRTTRQRARLDLLSTDANDYSVDVPSVFRSRNRHIAYILEMVRPLAAVIFHRPWGVGFSDYCLLTGDVPVLVLNGQDARDQMLAAAYWDIYLPLDPHRCLFMPGLHTRRRNSHWFDRSLKFHPGIAMAFNNAVSDVAVKHVFFHPDHDPTANIRMRDRVELEDDLSADTLPRHVVTYGFLHPDFGVQRRWLDEHPSASGNNAIPLSESELLHIVGTMAGELEEAETLFRGLTAE